MVVAVAPLLRGALVVRTVPPMPDLYLGVFTPDEIEQRYADLYDQATAYVEEQNKYHALPFFLDPGLLLVVTQSTYIDVARYKTFHFDDPIKQKLGAVKRAAFLTKWVSRAKPIYPIWPTGATSKPDSDAFVDLSVAPYATINEFFGITYSINSINDELEHDGFPPIVITAAVAKKIMYDIYYRDLTADGLMTFYETLTDASKGLVSPKS